METKSKKRPRRLWKAAGLFAAGSIAALVVLYLLMNIFEKKQQALNPFYRVTDLDDWTEDPAIWGRNFPFQYDAYLRTVDQIRTRYGGSEAVHRTPTKADPRSVVAQSRLEEDPRLKIIWDGYAFSKDFREERGHAHMLSDQEFTERQQFAKQPGTCLHCHASVYAPYRRLGRGDLVKGFELMNAMTYQEARAHVQHPITCLDCHDPQTMRLRVTRPAFLEGIQKVKALEGKKAYDVNTMATRQEMRTFVCAQCHDEYYFKGEKKRLTYPWDKGLKASQILAYYEENGFKDWVHKRTGAPMLKAQHPEFEMWSQGVHARSGVTCADCHMPYYKEGGTKLTDHHVRSPLLNISRSCQTCHHWPEAELKARAETNQQRTYEMRDIAMNAVVDLIHEIEKAMKNGVGDDRLKDARAYHRKAQFLLDFVEAENSTGFHAPAEAVRILGESINYARLGQLAVPH